MSGNKSIWWGPPRKFIEKLETRKISWLELFYDLVYIAVIGQLSEHLAENFCFEEVGHFLFLFSLVFWSWLNGSYYHDLHGNSGVRTRYFTLLQMMAITAVAITLKDTFNGSHQSFAISFATVQFIINYLWWSVSYYDPDHKILNRDYRIYYTLGIVLFLASVFTDAYWANILWGIALFFNYAVVFISRRRTERELGKRGIIYTCTYSIIERFGLFTIIVLGENIFGIVHGISEIEHKTASIWISFLLAVLIVFLLWWIYFDMLTESITKPGYEYFLYVNFINIPLFGAFVIIGSSIRMILESEGNNDYSRWYYCLGITAILFLIAALANIMEKDKEEEEVMKKLTRYLIITGFVMLIATPLIVHLNMVLLLATVALILIVPVIVGTRIWTQYILYGQKGEPENLIN